MQSISIMLRQLIIKSFLPLPSHNSSSFYRSTNTMDIIANPRRWDKPYLQCPDENTVSAGLSAHLDVRFAFLETTPAQNRYKIKYLVFEINPQNRSSWSFNGSQDSELLSLDGHFIRHQFFDS